MIENVLLIIMLAVLLGFVPAFLAWKSGRNLLLWWVYGIFLLPVALAHAIVLGRGGFGFKTIPCPYCRTQVGIDAPHCRKCGYDFMDTGR